MILFVNTLACGRGSKGFDNILISSLCILLLGKKLWTAAKRKTFTEWSSERLLQQEFGKRLVSGNYEAPAILA